MQELHLSPIIITGPHRSGTTMITRLLMNGGYWAGIRLDHNYESLFFQRRNEWVLRRSGASWDNPDSIEYLYKDKSLCNQVCHNFSKSIHSIEYIEYCGIRRYYNRSSLYKNAWGWKDPRTIFTLPIWKTIFEDAKLIYVIRNGVDVAASLQKRQMKDQKDYDRNSYALMNLGRRIKHAFIKYEPYIAQSVRCSDLESAYNIWERYATQGKKVYESYQGEKMMIKYEEFLKRRIECIKILYKFCNLQLNFHQAKELEQCIEDRRSFAFIGNEACENLYQRVKNSAVMSHYGYHDIIQ